MYCPNCSEPKANDATQFCKRCGLDLFGLNEFVESGESDLGGRFWRVRNAIRQGIPFFGFGLLLIPIWMFIALIFPPNDRLVERFPSTTTAETVTWILMWMAFIAGAVRIAYSMLFADKRGGIIRQMTNRSVTRSTDALPSGDYFRPADPGVWKNRDEIFEKVQKPSTTGEL